MRTLLVVDDIAHVRELVKIMLRENLLDVEILEAGHGKEAVELLNTKSIDLVLTDYQMPQMDGAKLCDYIRQRHPQTRVVLMSGTTINVPTDKADAFIRKPFRPQYLVATIMALL